jgi:16S rRNA (cytosine1402-N4)-methyltransferase
MRGERPVDNLLWTSSRGHAPVLLTEAVAALAPTPGGVYLDATFGGGGYSRALLRAAECRVLGLDRDPAAVARGRELAASCSRFTMLHGPFGAMAALAAAAGIQAVDGVVMDLGVSSYQLDDPARGFSFQAAGPLDMRMSQEGPSAADLVATLDEASLVGLLREHGDEPDARRIARAIVRRRAERPITRTDELAALVAAAKGGRRGPKDPATQTFQALRIAVNDELGELDRALDAAEGLLVEGGRLVVVAFHSAEDSRVKRFVDGRGGREVEAPRHRPPLRHEAPRWRWVGRKVVKPGPDEVRVNPRARSARLRVAIRQRVGSEPGPSDGSWSGELAA